jgi:hypothetical protein
MKRMVPMVTIVSTMSGIHFASLQELEFKCYSLNLANARYTSQIMDLSMQGGYILAARNKAVSCTHGGCSTQGIRYAWWMFYTIWVQYARC